MTYSSIQTAINQCQLTLSVWFILTSVFNGTSWSLFSTLLCQVWKLFHHQHKSSSFGIGCYEKNPREWSEENFWTSFKKSEKHFPLSNNSRQVKFSGRTRRVRQSETRDACAVSVCSIHHITMCGELDECLPSHMSLFFLQKTWQIVTAWSLGAPEASAWNQKHKFYVADLVSFSDAWRRIFYPHSCFSFQECTFGNL